MKKILSIFALVCVALVAVAINHTDSLFAIAGMPLFLDTAESRVAYQQVLELATTKSFIVASGDIRSEIVITNTSTMYAFDIRDTTLQGIVSTQPLVKGVLDNDLFIAFKQGIFVDYRTNAQSNVVLQTYPSNSAFTGSGATITDLWSFWNGLLTIQVGSTQFINQLSSATFLDVPQTQKSLTTNENQFDLNAKLKNIGTYSIFSGKGDNNVTLTIKSYAGFAPAATTSGHQNVLTYWAKGFVVKNGANAFEDFRKRISPNSGN